MGLSSWEVMLAQQRPLIVFHISILMFHLLHRAFLSLSSFSHTHSLPPSLSLSLFYSQLLRRSYRLSILDQCQLLEQYLMLCDSLLSLLTQCVRSIQEQEVVYTGSKPVHDQFSRTILYLQRLAPLSHSMQTFLHNFSVQR